MWVKAANSTSASSVMASGPNVPVIVAVSTLVDEVSVALKVPFPLSVTALKLPAVVLKPTVFPLLVRLFPNASLS